MTTIKTAYVTKAIKDIERLELSLRGIGMRSTPDIVGFYGELLALRKLKELFEPKGYAVSLGSGQTRADMVLRKGATKINVEIKTSRLKQEWHGLGYGYALNIKKCKTHQVFYDHPKRGKIEGDFCYFDFLVAVLLSEDLQKKEFYIFPRSLIEKQEKHLRNTNPRFSSASHRMIFLGDASTSKEISPFDRRLVSDRKSFTDWGIIAGN